METIGLIFVLLGIVIALFWIFLPFLVNGTNRRLDQLIGEIQALRATLERQKPQ
jgi:ABC-type sulfate transport system permease component